MEPVNPLNAPTTGYLASQPELPAPAAPAWQAREAQRTREANTSFIDYMGAMWRQDGLTDGLIAHHVGAQMVPDPTYSPYSQDEWKDLTDGVWPEFQPEFGQATSAAQARYMKDRLLQKQTELTQLGDLGVAGNVARFAFGAVSPENLAMGMVGGLVSKGLKGVQIANAMRGAKTATAEAAALAGVRASQAAAQTGIAPVAAGMVTAGVGNAAQEKLRQSVNFEHEDTAVLEAALIGLALPLPFELAGARAASRVSEIASKEHRLMKVAEKVSNGEQLQVHEIKLMDDMAKSAEAVKKVDEGKLSFAEARAEIDNIHGMTLPDRVWLDKWNDDLKGRVEGILDEMIPRRVVERTKAQMGLDNQPLQLGYESAAGRSMGAPMQVTTGGIALPPGVSKVEAERLIAEHANSQRPKGSPEADQLAASMRAELLGYKNEVATQLADAKATKAKLSPAERKLLAIEKSREGRKATMATSKKDPAATLLGDKPAEPVAAAPEAPKEAPAVAAEAPKEPAPADPTVPLVGEPVAPVKDAGFEVGDNVEWEHKATAERMWGHVESIREDGFLMVRNEEGKLQPVHPSRVLNDATYEAPQGFVAGGSVGAAQAAPIHDVGTQTSRLNKELVRFDIFAVLNRSESEKARSLVFSLVKDPLQVDAKEAQGWTASEVKSNIKRVVGGAFHREVRAAAKEAAAAMGIPMWQRGAFYHEFHSLTTRMTRGDFTVANANPTITPMLQRASKAQKELYADLLKRMQEAGVKGADEILPNDFYVNRVWNQKAIKDAKAKHGDAAVYQLLANSINVPGFNGDVAKAAQFLTAVQKLEFSQSMQNMHLGAKDMGTLRNELSRHLQPHEIDLIVNTMFEAKEVSGSDAGRMGNLKYRFDIGENLSATTPAGELRIADLFENDSRVLADSYLNSTGGHIGLAKQGIYSESDFTARIKDIQDESIANNLKGVAENVQLLQDVYSNIIGRPMSTQDFSSTARFASALRGYTRSVSLGQLGLTAAFEMKQAIGLMGFRTFMQQMPAFRGMVTAMRNGYFPDDVLARDLEHVTGFGSEMSSSYARAQEIDDGYMGQALSRFEEWSNKSSHAVDIMSGNASFTSLTRQLSSKMAAQRMSDFAHGIKEMTPKQRERLVGWGISDDHIDTVFGQLKKYSTVDKRGKLETIDWEKWQAEAPGTYETFQLANTRMVRDAIQDQDLGETMPFMHSTLGKVFAELKTFFLVAHAKNMLKNLSYMDQTALHVWAIAFIGEAMSYASQAGINTIGDPERREKMLNPMTIAGAAMARSPVSGMMPFLVNTAYQVGTGGESLIGADMTSSGNGRSFVPPSVQNMGRMWAAPATAMGLVLDNGNVTKQEGQDLYKLLPGSNMIGMRNLGSWLTNSLPTADQRQ